MASPYLQRPPRSLNEVQGELERRRQREHGASRRETADPETDGEAVGRGDTTCEF